MSRAWALLLVAFSLEQCQRTQRTDLRESQREDLTGQTGRLMLSHGLSMGAEVFDWASREC